MPTPRAGWLGALIVGGGAALFGTLGVASRFAFVQRGSRAPNEAGVVVPAPRGP
jgi:hypothetical protein